MSIRDNLVERGLLKARSFENWIKALDLIAGDSDYGPAPMSKNTGVACWRGYYDDAYSPGQAWAEDQSHDD